jgi:hypothetical protein
MKRSFIFPGRLFLLLASLSCFLLFAVFQSCQKSIEPVSKEQSLNGRRKPKDPPPPPPPFYFANCSYPQFSGTFAAGNPANVTITMNYVNSQGGNYSAFSITVNGLTITAPAGTFNIGSGTVIFTATGTPVNPGICPVTISVGNIIPCQIHLTIRYPQPDPSTCGSDPGITPGSIGCVTFNYRGQNVSYYTVRGRDGKIWLRQNLGSPHIPLHEGDEASFGDYFQWGRWDDGHQLPGSGVVTGSATLQNPSHISSGNPNFIIGSTSSTAWWGMGVSSDSWTGNIVTSTNGKDPCAVLGAGWRMPTITDWQNVSTYEDITSTISAFMSNLKLPSAGYRWPSQGGVYTSGTGHYWSATSSDNGNGRAFSFDPNYVPFFDAASRGTGLSCRCVKY